MRVKRGIVGILLGVMLFGMTAQAAEKEEPKYLEYKDGEGTVVKYTKDEQGICRLEDGSTWQHPDIWTSTTGFGESFSPKTKSELGKKAFMELQKKEEGISYWEKELDTDTIELDYTSSSNFDVLGLEFAAKSAGLEFNEEGVATKELDPESAFMLQSYLAQKGSWERMLYRLDENITVTVKVNPNAEFLLICSVFVPTLLLLGLLIGLGCYVNQDGKLGKKATTYTDKRKKNKNK